MSPKYTTCMIGKASKYILFFEIRLNVVNAYNVKAREIGINSWINLKYRLLG